MRGRIFGFSGVRGASVRWLWLALAAALVLVACGGGGGGGGGSGGGDVATFSGPSASLSSIVDRISESNTATAAVMRVSFQNVPDDAVRAVCIFQLESDADGDGQDYTFAHNDEDSDPYDSYVEIDCGGSNGVSEPAISGAFNIFIKIRWDADNEDHETLQLTLTRAMFYDSSNKMLANARIYSATATVIIEDESPASVKSFSANPTDIDENGGVSTLTLTLDQAIPEDGADLTFPYTITGPVSASDITAGSLTGNIVVRAGEKFGMTTITAVDDDLDESLGETMIITLDDPAMPELEPWRMVSGIDPVQITIIDNDGSTGIPPESVSEFRALPIHIDEDGGVSTLTLILNSQVPSGDPALIFPYIINGINITAEDITSPDLTGFITVEPGSNTGTTDIIAMNDDQDEGAREAMTIRLGTLPENAAGNPITVEGAGPFEITITIADDDGSTGIPPQSVASFRAVPTHIDEDGGISTLTLELNSRIPSGDPALTFRYVISGTNINAEDITASDLTGSITVDPNSNTGTTDITGLDDPAIEGDEIMAIRLDAAALPDNASGNKLTADGIGPVRITITDDDVAIQPDRVTGFSVAPAQIDEGGGGAILTLELNRRIPDGDGDRALTFPYIISGDTITAADVAAPGLTGVMTVAAGDITGTATITALQDFAAEGDETMIVRLGVLPDNAGGIRLAADGIGPVEITIMDARVLTICNASLIGDPEPDAAPVTTGNIRQTITLSAGEAVVNAALDSPDYYHVYRLMLARAGRLVITPDSILDLEAVFFRAPVLSGGNCPPDEDGYASDIDPDGGNFNFSFDGDLEAGAYYLVVNDYYEDPGAYRLQMTFTPPDDVGGNAPSDAAGEQARLTRQVRALALSTMAAQTGMLTDLVRRRGRATPAMDGVRFGPLPDEGGGGDLRSLLKSSLSLQHSYRLDSGGYASAWMSSTATSLAGDPASLHAGLEWAAADRRAIHGLAISAGSSSVVFPANVAGLENTGPQRAPNRQPNNQWPNKQWNESMTLIAPYLTRRTDSADIWITAGIGGGEVRLDGSGGDATIMFLQAGAAWKKILSSGQRFDLEARGRAARKHVSGFRLNAHDIPGLTLDLFQLDGRASFLWPLSLAGGIVRPGVKVDFSHDFSDILPGRDRQRLRSVSAVSWTRGLFSAALESRQHSAGRKPPWRNLTARMKLDSGDGFTTTLDGLFGGRGVQFTLKGVF